MRVEVDVDTEVRFEHSFLLFLPSPQPLHFLSQRCTMLSLFFICKSLCLCRKFQISINKYFALLYFIIALFLCCEIFDSHWFLLSFYFAVITCTLFDVLSVAVFDIRDRVVKRSIVLKVFIIV